jgi:YVTN family beta-propeller protein
VRFASLLAFACLTVPAATVGACDESFPALPPPSADASTGTQLEAEPPADVAPSARVNASSSNVVYDPLRRAVWTANGDVGTISYVDPVGRRVAAEVHVGQDIRSVAVSPDGAWVAAVDRAGAAVVLVDAPSRVVQATIPLGSHPRACVWDSANPRWLYVTEEDAGVVDVIDRTYGAVADTIPVGRLPAGLAVSASRREVYVSHRIDAELTVVDLHDRAVAAQIALSDEPFTDPATPNGKPMGLDSFGLTAIGGAAWIPHELLSTTHPFVFNETIFPAISVANLVGREEQVSDPNSSVVAGRKNLFDAIDIVGPDGQPAIFSQLCAVSVHPDDHVAWALACGSQDLITFSVDDGVASAAIRNLPCDHPSGMTLDATGDRLYVMCDQSKQLLSFNTAGGDPVGLTQMDAPPLLVATDTVAAIDPQLRAGLTLFYQANSNKGTLATTGNDWMSCSACHLDGFGSTNLRLFEALLPPPNPAVDAQIGHVGLADVFSTTVQVGQSSFDPHDLLVALTDQGGLAPDRTGVDRTGAVDPSHPSSAAVQMAQELARVVAGDLPSQPTWLRGYGGPPDTTYDTSWCGQCHATEYAAWKESLHANAAKDPATLFAMGKVQAEIGAQSSRLCAGCHDPVSTRGGDTTLTSGRGVTCLGCHDVTGLTQAGGNGDLQATSHDWTQDHKARAQASLQTLQRPEFCGGCHSQFVPGNGMRMIDTLPEWQSSLYAPDTPCVDCHMKPVSSGFDHRFPGGNLFMGQQFGDSTLTAGETYNLTHVMQIQAQAVPGGVQVTLRNGGAGHSFPTGVTDVREAWVEIQPMDAQGHALAHVGGPASASDLLPAGAARLGTDIAGADGSLLLLHQITAATHTPFDVRVPSGEAVTLFVPVPGPMPAGTVEIDAVLEQRALRTTFYQALTGGGAAPQTEMARAKVGGP